MSRGAISERGMAATDAADDGTAGRMGRLARGLAIVGGVLLLLIAVFVTASVVMRAMTGSGIDGDFELVQIAAALAAFCLFPFCIVTRGNIRVDTFSSRWPQPLNRFLDGLWDVLFGVITATFAARMVVGALDQFNSNTTSIVLGIPTFWAVAVCAALLAVLAVVSLVVGLRLIGRRP
jgi:TRAP-type C4-dicarboxylate transport system permease small subunit